MTDYSFLKDSKTADKWQKIGFRKRAGVAVPLFSVKSKRSIGIGEIPDIKLIVQWCKQTGSTILQLLPLNDTGYDYAPYNCVSSFAVDPMYLCIQSLKEVNLTPFKKDIRWLRSQFSNYNYKVDYAIKDKKIELLWRIYKRSYLKAIRKFEKFSEDNDYWLKDYAIYKVLKHINKNESWENWPERYKNRDKQALIEFENGNSEKIRFHYWLQWQLYEQLVKVKKYANENGILIMGDIPFLVSRDSCDVWSRRNYFDLNLQSGAPPDMYFAKGQRWGMPPYNRTELEIDGHEYFIGKLIYAENFFDMFRIDHFVGFFRVWTIERYESEETGGLNGKFSPDDEKAWEDTGKKLLDTIINKSSLLPCAEDLGTVPECSARVLWEYGIPGMDVQRWIKNNNNFVPKEKFRWLSVVTVSTHDSSSLTEWWQNEAGTIDGLLFERLLKEKGFNSVQIDESKSRLFELENSHYNRLRWRKEIDTREKFLEIIGLTLENSWDIAVLYDESYGEKDKFLERVFGTRDELNTSKVNEEVNTEFIKKTLEFVCGSDSVFCIQLLQEYLCFDENFLRMVKERSFRINFPGVVNDENWTVVLPMNLEKICKLDINKEIFEMNSKYNRV